MENSISVEGQQSWQRPLPFVLTDPSHSAWSSRTKSSDWKSQRTLSTSPELPEDQHTHIASASTNASKSWTFSRRRQRRSARWNHHPGQSCRHSYTSPLSLQGHMLFSFFSNETFGISALVRKTDRPDAYQKFPCIWIVRRGSWLRCVQREDPYPTMVATHWQMHRTQFSCQETTYLLNNFI